MFQDGLKKRLKHKIKNHKPCFEKLFSKTRIESYESIQQYLSNLALVERITPIIGELEVCIRNKIHLAMSEESDFEWIFDFIKNKNPSVDFRSLFDYFEQSDEKGFYEKRDLIKKDRFYSILVGSVNKFFKKSENFSAEEFWTFKKSFVDILISRHSCGFWGEVLMANPNIHFLDNPHYLNFELYNGRVLNKKDYTLIQAYNDETLRDRISFFLLKNLRNRAFHWENLLKIQNKNSRITAQIEYGSEKRKINFEIKPKMIERFLWDMIKATELDLKKVLKMYEDFRR